MFTARERSWLAVHAREGFLRDTPERGQQCSHDFWGVECMLTAMCGGDDDCGEFCSEENRGPQHVYSRQHLPRALQQTPNQPTIPWTEIPLKSPRDQEISTASYVVPGRGRGSHLSFRKPRW